MPMASAVQVCDARDDAMLAAVGVQKKAESGKRNAEC